MALSSDASRPSFWAVETRQGAIFVAHDTSRIAWAKFVQAHTDREAIQPSPDELPAIDLYSLWAAARSELLDVSCVGRRLKP